MSPLPRFKWTPPRDAVLTAIWPQHDVDAERIGHALGCSRRAVFKRGAELQLGPRDPVRAAIARGEGLRDPRAVTLPAIRFHDLADEDAGAARDGVARSQTRVGEFA